MSKDQTTAEQALWAVKEAFRNYIDAHDTELAEAGMTRADALRKARDMDAALPGQTATEPQPPWRDEALRAIRDAQYAIKQGAGPSAITCLAEAITIISLSLKATP
jgi:hypothetical protein